MTLEEYYAEYERNRPQMVVNLAKGNANPDEEPEVMEAPGEDC